MKKDTKVASKKERKGIWLKIKSLFSVKTYHKNVLTKEIHSSSSQDSSSYSSYSSQLTKSTVASAVENDKYFGLSIPLTLGSASTCANRMSDITSVYDNPIWEQFNYSSIEVLNQHNDNANFDGQSHNSRPTQRRQSPNRQRPSRARGRTAQVSKRSRDSRPRPRTPSGSRRSPSPYAAASGKESEKRTRDNERQQRSKTSTGNPITTLNKDSGRTSPTENKSISTETSRHASRTPVSVRKPTLRSHARTRPSEASQRSARPIHRTGGRLSQRLPRQSARGGANIRNPRSQRLDDPRRIAGGILKAIDKPPPKVALGNKFCKKKLRRRNERLKRRVRRRLDFALQAMDSQSKIGFLIQNASKRTPLTYPMFPYFPNEWAKGCLPLQSRDPSVLIKLYTWLLGLEEVLRTMNKNDELKLRRKVACRLSAEDEVGAVKMISGQLRSENEEDYKAAWHVLSNDNYFRDYAAQRTYLERKEGMLLSIRSLKTTVKWQLENVCKGMFP